MERDYKAKYEDVLKEKQKLELEFGQRRAQFRQLFLDLEGMYLFCVSNTQVSSSFHQLKWKVKLVVRFKIAYSMRF